MVYRTLDQEFKKADEFVKKNWGTERRHIPVDSGFTQGHVTLLEAYTNIFLRRGRQFTEDYLIGRRARISNLFSTKYRAARQAILSMDTEMIPEASS